MRRYTVLVAVVGILAAVGIGFWFASISGPAETDEIANQQAPSPNQDNTDIDSNDDITEAAANDQELIYSTFLAAGWPEESAVVFSTIKTEFQESNSTNVSYTQTLPSGITRDVRITATPGERYVPIEANKLYTHLGTLVYLKDAAFYTGDDFNATRISYFFPYDSLDSEFVEQMGWADPHLQVEGLNIAGIQYASATTETTGVGIARTVISPSQPSAAPFDMDARLADAEADVARFERERAYESIFQEGREITNMDPNDPIVREVNRHLTPEAVELRRQQAAFHDAETRQMVDEIRTRYELADNARVNTKWLIRITGAAGVGLAGYELYTIDDQHDLRSAWLNYYEDCVRNPDIPRFNDPRGDPGFDQAIEQIESAREGIGVTTRAMQGASIMNGAAGLAAHNPLVDALTMAASMAEQAMLERAIQYDMSGLSELNSPCRPPPCDDTQEEPPSPPPPTPYGDYTPGPDEAGFFMTMGPREWYEPPERRVCLPPEPNQVTLRINEFEDGSTGTPREVTFVATANVTNMFPIPGSNSFYQVNDHYEGNATAAYHDITGYDDATTPEPECVVQIDGLATMKVKILRFMSGPLDRNGVYTLAEVQVSIVGDLPIRQSPPGCYVLNSSPPSRTSEIGETIYSCSFFDVNENGGVYRNGSGPVSLDSTNIFYDDCELTLGPLRPELMVPH